MKNYSNKIIRFKGEIGALLLLLVVVFALVYFFLETNIYFLVGVILFGLLYIRLLQAQQLGNSLQISEHQFPEIYSIAKECANILDVKRVPRVFITQDPTMNAYTMGFISPYTLVLNSGLVENLSLDELRVVIGHEMGHVKFKHSMILSLIAPIGRNFAFSDLLFGFWGRKTEYTCDRCALICAKEEKTVLRTLVKIAAGAKIGQGVDLDKLVLQLQDAKAHRIDRLGELLVSHPYIMKRIWEIIKFSYQYNPAPCKRCKNLNLREAQFCFSCGNQIIV